MFLDSLKVSLCWGSCPEWQSGKHLPPAPLPLLIPAPDKQPLISPEHVSSASSSVKGRKAGGQLGPLYFSRHVDVSLLRGESWELVLCSSSVLTLIVLSGFGGSVFSLPLTPSFDYLREDLLSLSLRAHFYYRASQRKKQCPQTSLVYN